MTSVRRRCPMSEDVQRTNTEQGFGAGMTDDEWLTPRCTCGADCHAKAESLQAEVEKWKARYEGLLERVK